MRPPQPPPPPPLVVRQRAPPLPTPPPLVLRERPPVPPLATASQTGREARMGDDFDRRFALIFSPSSTTGFASSTKISDHRTSTSSSTKTT